VAVFKVNKTEDYTVMANSHFRNHKISLKAKGLLSLMLSLPDDWDYSLEGLATLCSDGLSSVKTTLKELEKLGYVEVVKMMPGTTKSGRIEYEYNIYEIPKQEYEKQEVEILPLEIQPLEIQPTENRRQLNTNKSNTNKSNNSASAEAQELFERLWKLYPRKKGKSAVKLSTKKKLLKVGEEKLTQAIERYSREVEGKDEQYILMGSTFFNGRYEDYLEEPEVKKNKYGI